MPQIKKVIFVIDSLIGGGAEKVMTVLANRFADTGIEVVIGLINSKGITPVYSVATNIKIVDFSENKVSGKFGLLKSIIELRRYVKNNDFNVIISFMMHVSLLVLLSCGNLKTPIVIRTANDPERELFSPFHKRMTRYLLPNAKGAVFQNQHQADYYDRYLRGNKYAIIMNPINSNPLWAIEKDYSTKTIIAVGRLVEAKNYPLLIHAFANIYKHHSQWKLHIFGDGNKKEELTEIITALDLNDSIILTGFTKEIDKELHNASIYVMSSLYEGMPNALTEAMCMGCACITTDFSGGASEILIENNVTGIIVENNNEEALSSAMSLVMNDVSLRTELGHNATQLRKQVDSKTIANLWLEYLGDL